MDLKTNEKYSHDCHVYKDTFYFLIYDTKNFLGAYSDPTACRARCRSSILYDCKENGEENVYR